ncbi:MAG TPA: redox-regulated ATPase YchF [Ignavibacteriaceae bacterium]|nr:redox-regulated ATPase YchF [Ignavibacteriaceae bacterium]
MGLSIGIVGLPNVGKSTLFNALTKAQNAESANYPFCTIEPNKAVVPVPDERIDKLAKLVNPARVVNSTVDFVDIAGLVKGASKGEGLGNQFLTNIRETEAILQVIRCFDNDDVVHVDGSVDPIRDIEVIETELLLADVQTLEKKIEKLQKMAKGDKAAKIMLEDAEKLVMFMNEGNPAILYLGNEKESVIQLFNELRLMTAKKVIYCANVDEDGLADDNDYVKKVKEFAQKKGADSIKISAKVEEELVGLEESEREEFLDSYGVKESGLEKIIRTGFHTLGLNSYFTAGPKEVRAWTIHKGWKAPLAAGVIHTDFEKGFIRAEVISYDDYVKHGSEAACRTAGVLRIEGKDYIVKDGDVMHFLFNV